MKKNFLIFLKVTFQYLFFIGETFGLSFLTNESFITAEKKKLLQKHEKFSLEEFFSRKNFEKDKVYSELVKIDDSITPNISAKSYILYIPETGQILIGKNIHEKRSVASITKLVTALVIFFQEKNLDKEIEVHSGIYLNKEESAVGVEAGEKIRLKELLKGLLISSGNDLAWVVSGGFKNKESENFVHKMNEMALFLGAKNTNFKNPTGLDEDGQFSTAFDVALISWEVIKNPFFRNIISKKEDTMTTSKKTYYLKNTNQLLWYPYLKIEGIKTGTTEKAGQCLVSFIEKNRLTIIGVVLGSDDRYFDMKVLFDLVGR